MNTRTRPLLPINPTLRQRAISAATRLMTEFTKGGQYCVPVGKYALEVCKLFRIPLLPKESPIKVAVKKLEEWRALVNFRKVTGEDYVAFNYWIDQRRNQILQVIKIEFLNLSCNFSYFR
jgi:hypothetical protein